MKYTAKATTIIIIPITSSYYPPLLIPTHLFLFFLIFFRLPLLFAQPSINIDPNLPSPIRQSLQEAIDANPHSIENIEDLKNISAQTLQAFGYMAGTCLIKAPQVETTPLSLQCILGPPTTIKNVSIRVIGPGKTILENAIKQSGLHFKNNIQFQTIHYETFKTQLLQEARTFGFLDANANGSQVTIDADEHTATISFQIDTGMQYSFGQIEFANTSLSPTLLTQLSPFKKGEPYNASLIADYQQKLLITGFFREIQVQPSNIKAPTSHQIPISVHYTLTNFWSEHLMLGYDTDEGATFMASITRNHLNAWGAQWNNTLHLSEQQYLFSSEFRIPKTHPLHDFYLINIEASRELLEPSGHSDALALRASYHPQHILASYIINSIYRLNLTLERSKSNDSDIVEQWRPFFYPDWHLSYTSTPSKAFVIDFSSQISGSLPPLAPDPFFRALNKINLLWKPNPHYRLLSRVQLGYLFTPKRAAPLPLSWYFRAGGMNSIRGFAYHSLGNEVLYTNTQLATAGIELQREIIQSIFGTVFLDLGSVGSDFKNYATSVGMGVVWESPLGNIELSIAKPITDTFKHQYRPHVGFTLRHSFF